MTNREDERPRRMSLLQVAQSVLAAFFGVQSERNRQRDFEHGSGRASLRKPTTGKQLL